MNQQCNTSFSAQIHHIIVNKADVNWTPLLADLANIAPAALRRKVASDNEASRLANPPQCYPFSSSMLDILQTTLEWYSSWGCHQSVAWWQEVGFGGQRFPSGRLHYQTIGFISLDVSGLSVAQGHYANYVIIGQ